ncbi:MAG TPA: hypothetical protein VGP47_11815 [Parachlamydiaceae bacterium]|nr:hypothetical protein [Parachlamydiaceae bacterium]
MLPIEPQPDYTQLVQRWYDAAANDFDTSSRMELYKDTENAVKHLEKMGMSQEAKNLGKVILQTFDNHSVNESELLAHWISQNTNHSGKGAYPVLHRLFERAEKLTVGQGNSDISREQLANLKHIGALALGFLESNKVTPQGLQLPNDSMNLIVSDFAQSSPTVIDSLALRATSKTTRQQAIEAYRGYLTELNITTANQAIKYVKENGSYLKYINISNIAFNKEEFKEFIKHIPKIREFIAFNCNLGDVCIKALASSKAFSNVKELELSDNKISDAGAEALAASTYLGKVTTLNLYRNNIGPAGAKSIAVSKNLLKNLTSLDLSANSIKDEGAVAFASAELFNMKELDVSSNDIGDVGVGAFATSKNMGEMTVLKLAGNKIGIAGAKALALTDSLKLTDLDLSHNNIGREGREALASSEALRNTKINLRYNF